MTLQEAIQILIVHQAWRLGANIEMAEPKVITEALDVLLNYHTETTPISDEEITKLANEHVLYNDSKRQWVVEGMKLYKEQLKTK